MATKIISRVKKNTNGTSTTITRVVNTQPGVADLPVDTLDDVMRRSNPPHRVLQGGTQG